MDVFLIPQVVYRIAWHVDDHRSWSNFARVNWLTAQAARYWMKTKQTQFTRTMHWGILGVPYLPNGEFHGFLILPNRTIRYEYGYTINIIVNDGRRINYSKDQYNYVRNRHIIQVDTNSLFVENEHRGRFRFSVCGYCGRWCFHFWDNGFSTKKSYESKPCRYC